MHFITGGAFNGKRAWVKKIYPNGYWHSAYKGDHIPKEIPVSDNLLILEGIELWLRDLSMEYDSTQCLKIWNNCLEQWMLWENSQENRKLVIIATDITKGIVPMESENRLWRDVTGWAYQQLAAKAVKVDLIWYGINQPIK